MTEVAEVTRRNRRIERSEFALGSVCSLTPDFEGTVRHERFPAGIRTKVIDAGTQSFSIM